MATIQDGTGIYVATVGGTADVITLTPSPVITAYAAGQTFRFIASGSNTTNVTVAISGLVAKAVTKNGSTALVSGDIPSGNIVEITYDGTRFQLGSVGASTYLPPFIDSTAIIKGSGDTTKLIRDEADALTTATTRVRYMVDEDVSIGNSWDIRNLAITATVSASALTIALKTKNLTDPSATDPVIVKFRDVTLTTGDYATVSITSALSLVVSSGSTLGTISAQASRLYIVLFNDAGTPRLGIYNPWNGTTTSLLGLVEENLYSSTAEGGAGGADSAQVIYTGTAVSSKAMRLIAYIESTQATAGTWATDPSKKQLIGPGVKKTGDRIQIARNDSGTSATGTTILPLDNTIPQNTEGVQFMTQAITPTNAANILNVRTRLLGAHSVNAYLIAALFRDSTANALAVGIDFAAATNSMHGVNVDYTVVGNTASSTTFNVRMGAASAGTVTFNGDSGAQNFGGVANSYISVEEIFA